jgi:hypothetical protein
VAKQKFPAAWTSKYTDPELRARLKDEVTAGDKGGKPGQWSARKAQLLKAEYEKSGGGYLGPKDDTQKHLSEWTKQDWQTSDGSTRARTGSKKEKGGASKRYLPKKAWEELSEEEKRATDSEKAKGSEAGEQFVGNPPAAKRAGRRARRSERGADLPIEAYDQLSAREAVRAVGQLTDVREVRAVRDHERGHGDRKTVLDRVDRMLDRLG